MWHRSRFITEAVEEAVERELVRRRREGLLRSLQHPHPEAAELAEMGLVDWGASLPADDEGLVDVTRLDHPTNQILSPSGREPYRSVATCSPVTGVLPRFCCAV